MSEGAAPHTHQGLLGPFTCACCMPDLTPEASVEAPSWWSWLTGRTEPEREA